MNEEKIAQEAPQLSFRFLLATSEEYDRKQKHLFPVALLYCAFLVTHMQTRSQAVWGIVSSFII